MHAVSFSSLSALKKKTDTAKFLQGPKLHKYQRRRPRFRPSHHKLPPALSISASTNYAGPLSTASPARGIPVTEVHKWQQQQPKLQQRQPQRIPSNAG
jgi:hypothetical protein